MVTPTKFINEKQLNSESRQTKNNKRSLKQILKSQENQESLSEEQEFKPKFQKIFEITKIERTIIEQEEPALQNTNNKRIRKYEPAFFEETDTRKTKSTDQLIKEIIRAFRYTLFKQQFIRLYSKTT